MIELGCSSRHKTTIFYIFRGMDENHKDWLKRRFDRHIWSFNKHAIQLSKDVIIFNILHKYARLHGELPISSWQRSVVKNRNAMDLASAWPYLLSVFPAQFVASAVHYRDV